MPKKRIKKYRGSGTHGGGSRKRRRGRGSRGGGGKAGGHKHHYIKMIKMGYEFGKHGFTRPKVVSMEHKAIQNLRRVLKKLRSEGKLDDYTYKYFYSRHKINVGDIDTIIDKLVELKIAAKKGKVYTLNLTQLGYSKLLGRGSVTKVIHVRVEEATQNAITKIGNAGGKVITQKK